MNDRAANLLAKLAAKTQSMTTGNGGIPELMQTDIAAAQSGSHYLSYLICRVKYTGDNGFKMLLVATIANRVLYLAKKRHKTIKRGRAIRMAGVALSELLECGRHKACNGTGRYNGGDCRGCMGTGIIEWSDFYIASNIGMDIRTYNNNYKRFYDELVGYLQQRERQGLSHIKFKCE